MAAPPTDPEQVLHHDLRQHRDELQRTADGFAAPGDVPTDPSAGGHA